MFSRPDKEMNGKKRGRNLCHPLSKFKLKEGVLFCASAAFWTNLEAMKNVTNRKVVASGKRHTLLPSLDAEMPQEYNGRLNPQHSERWTESGQSPHSSISIIKTKHSSFENVTYFQSFHRDTWSRKEERNSETKDPRSSPSSILALGIRQAIKLRRQHEG